MLHPALYIITAFICGWLIYRWIYLRRKQRQYQEALSDIFSHQEIDRPVLKTSFSYGYPRFEVIFENKRQFELANELGSTNDFIARIQALHKGMKGFDAERAVCITWEGGA